MVTTSDIANKLGISRGTVSRALNNHPNITQATRELILNTAKELGYGFAPSPIKECFKIGVIVFSEPAFFWEQIKIGINRATAEFSHSNISVDYFVTDILNPNEQLEILNNLIAENYNAIALSPNDPTISSMVDLIDEITSKNIPILLFNVDIPTSNRLCYVGSDYTQAGKLAGQVFVNALGHSPSKIAMFTLADQVFPIEQRISGFRSILSKNPHVTLSYIHRFNRKGEGVYETALNLLKSTPDLDGIFVTFGALSEVARAINDLKLNHKITLVGYDLCEEIGQYLKNGAVTSTICHAPLSQGYFAIKLLANYLCNHTLPNTSLLYTKLEVIMPYNVDSYLNEIQYFDI